MKLRQIQTQDVAFESFLNPFERMNDLCNGQTCSLCPWSNYSELNSGLLLPVTRFRFLSLWNVVIFGCEQHSLL